MYGYTGIPSERLTILQYYRQKPSYMTTRLIVLTPVIGTSYYVTLATKSVFEVRMIIL